ncbi:MAG: hypothetical protein EBY93_00245 [Actinobacteria bacterium]|nr:hypothetical protein [Actinomycetota bacterium]
MCPPRATDVGERKRGENPRGDGDAVDGNSEAVRRPDEDDEIERNEHDAGASRGAREDREDA